MLKVVAYLNERGDYEELHEIIKQPGRQIDRIQGRRPRGGIEPERRRDCLASIAYGSA